MRPQLPDLARRHRGSRSPAPWRRRRATLPSWLVDSRCDGLDGYPPAGHMAPKPELPPPGPASGSFGGRSFKALEFAFVPAWLPPGSRDTPGAGAIADTPLSPLWASAFVTPSPTIGHRNSPLLPTAGAGGSASAAAEVATIPPRTRARTNTPRPRRLFMSHPSCPDHPSSATR